MSMRNLEAEARLLVEGYTPDLERAAESHMAYLDNDNGRLYCVEPDALAYALESIGCGKGKGKGRSSK